MVSEDDKDEDEDEDDESFESFLRELDAEIAEKVIFHSGKHSDDGEGWCGDCGEEMHRFKLMAAHQYGTPEPEETKCLGKHYSTDISAAMEVVEKIRDRKLGLPFMNMQTNNTWRVWFGTKRAIRDSDVWYAETLPVAICRAALAAVESETKPTT